VQDETTSQGALVLLKKAFVLGGDSRELVAFLNSQKRSFTVIEKIGREGRFKFLVLDGEATYAQHLARDLPDALRTQYHFLAGVSKALLEVASSYLAGVTELEKAPFEVADLLLGDPLFLAASKSAEGAASAFEEKPGAAGGGAAQQAARASRAARQVKRFAFLGLNSSRESFAIDLNSFRRVTVAGKDKAAAARLLQVLGEGALLNNVSCLVFASSGALRGFGEAALERGNYDYFHLQGEPHGFPVKEFSLATLKIDLARVGSDDFLGALGLQQTDFADAIAAAFDAAPAHDIVALMENLDKIGAANAALFPPAVRARALRVLKCLEREFPHSFGENKPPLLEEALRGAREKTLASVLWLDAAGVPELLKQLHYCHTAALLAQHFAKTAFVSASENIDFLVLVDEDAVLVGEAARRALARASEAGVGFCLWSEYSSDTAGIQSTLAFELVGADAFASVEGIKTKFALRPTYSRSGEKSKPAAALPAGKPSFFSFSRAAQAPPARAPAAQAAQAGKPAEKKVEKPALPEPPPAPLASAAKPIEKPPGKPPVKPDAKHAFSMPKISLFQKPQQTKKTPLPTKK
jgi:hypothetical protein